MKNQHYFAWTYICLICFISLKNVTAQNHTLSNNNSSSSSNFTPSANTTTTNTNTTFHFSTNIYYGRIADYTYLFEPEVTEGTWMYELKFGKKTLGQKQWQHAHNYPFIGLSFLYAQYGDAAIFGHSYSLAPYISYHYQFKKLHYFWQAQVGLAYLNRPYHAVYNQTNNVIGSKVNAIAKLGAGLQFKIHPQVHMQAHLSLTHWSNGKVQSPNLGINVGAAGISLLYFPTVPNFSPYPIANRTATPIIDKRIFVNIKLGYGLTESNTAGGPKYGVFNAAIILNKRRNIKTQYLAGIEFDYYMNLYYYTINQVAYQEKIYRKALKVYPFIGYELFFGQVSISLQGGLYVFNPFGEKRLTPTKLSLQYYMLPTYARSHKNLFISLYLKGHLSKADHVGMSLGYGF